MAAGEDEAKYASRNIMVRKLIARLLEKLKEAAGSTSETWIDIGIGEGLAIEAMEVHAASLVGVEYRHDKLASALERLPSASGVRADAGMLPFTDRSAEIVTCLEVLEHLEAPERAVEELAADLSGSLCCVCPLGALLPPRQSSAEERTSGIGVTTQSTSNNFNRRVSEGCWVDHSKGSKSGPVSRG